MADPSPDRGPAAPRGPHVIFGCLASLLLALAGVGVVWLALTLAARGELAVGRGTPTEARLWLVSQAGNQGLGLSFARARPEAGTGQVCADTTVQFLLWRSDGAAQGTSYCTCYRRVGAGWETVGGCEP